MLGRRELLRSSPMLGQPAQTAVNTSTCIFHLDKLTPSKSIFHLDKLTPSKRRVRCPLLHPFVAPTLFWPQPLFPIITTLFAAWLPLSHAHPASCLSQVHSFVLCVNNNIKIHVHNIGKKQNRCDLGVCGTAAHPITIVA